MRTRASVHSFELKPHSLAAQQGFLAVSGAFHTPYMSAASEALGKALDAADVKMPSIKASLPAAST